MTRLGHVPALDGLRGIAIAAVVGYHAFGYPVGGWVGVQLFFVLSGFLITTLLLEQDRIRLGPFYARRARRLLPALVTLLVVYVAICALKGIDGLPAVARWGFYTGNAYAAFWPGASTRIVGLNHLWSLAQEEQFYLVWPAALIAVRRLRHPARVLVAIVAVLIAYRAILVDTGASSARVYFAPDVNVDGLLLGATLAFRRVAVPRWSVKLAFAVLLLVAALIPSAASTVAIAVPLGELASAVLIAAAANRTLTLPRPLIWLGGISYSLYLWHAVVLWAFAWHDRLLAVAVALAAAQASTQWIEKPFRRRRASRAAGPLPATA